jgi:hypothetical protein
MRALHGSFLIAGKPCKTSGKPLQAEQIEADRRIPPHGLPLSAAPG